MPRKLQRRNKSAQTITAQKNRLYLEGLHNSKAYLTYKTTDQVFEMVKKHEMVIPPYQRNGGVWKDSQDQELIMTMIRGLPVLPFLVQFDTKTGKYSLLDGQQRNLNQMLFRTNKIKISKKFDISRGGMRFRDLEPETQKNYLKYPIPFLVVVGGNGVGRDTYIRANSGLPINASEKRRAKFYDTSFFKLVRKVSRKLLKFYTDNKILTEHDVLRCKDEDVIAENILLVVRGVSDGSDLDDTYDRMRTPKQLSNIITEDPEKLLKGYFRTISEMFPKGLKQTGFDNPNHFYGLLGAVKEAIEKNLLPTTGKTKADLGARLQKFLAEVGSIHSDPDGNHSASARKYHSTVVRGTRDLKNREDRIQVLVDVITKN